MLPPRLAARKVDGLAARPLVTGAVRSCASAPEQSSSTPLSGMSVAPGLIAALWSLQSWSWGPPSPSASVCVKVAVTERAWLIVTVQVPVPEHPSPLHPVNVERGSALADSVTGVPVSYGWVQLDPQPISPRLLDTTPLPAPA